MKVVVWREVGEYITFQCRSKSSQSFLHFKRGLRQETSIVYAEKSAQKKPVVRGLVDRVQINGTFPKINILLRNLDLNDTGPYWCIYSKNTYKEMVTVGEGSVVLVVKGKSNISCKTLLHLVRKLCFAQKMKYDEQ